MTPVEAIVAAIRDVPDFPKEGIVFKDITPILADPVLLRDAIELLATPYRSRGIAKVAAVEARGFILGVGVAQALQAGFVPIRKQGKLPGATVSQDYDLEYGKATLELHRDAFTPGERVLLLDDLLATGGTAAAAANLIEQAGGEVAAIEFLIELDFLNGRARLDGYHVHAPIHVTD